MFMPGPLTQRHWVTVAVSGEENRWLRALRNLNWPDSEMTFDFILVGNNSSNHLLKSACFHFVGSGGQNPSHRSLAIPLLAFLGNLCLSCFPLLQVVQMFDRVGAGLVLRPLSDFLPFTFISLFSCSLKTDYFISYRYHRTAFSVSRRNLLLIQLKGIILIVSSKIFV